MHCFCRSTTVPVIKWDDEDEEVGERISRDPLTGRNNFIKNMTYKEWKSRQFD